jgi:putative MATE family efflux protein
LRDLTVGNESKQIFLFAIPMLLSNFLQQLYNVVDRMIVGRFISTEALAAVGESFPVIFVMISLLWGTSSGITVVVSQYYGAKDMDRVARSISTFFIFIFFASILMTGVGLLFAEKIFIILRLPQEVMGDALDYLNIYLAGLVFAFLFYGTNAILRGLGDSGTPLLFVLFSTVLNIILDIVFVLYFGWAIKGVAWATVIAQAVTVFIAIYYLNKKGDLIKFSLKSMRFDMDIFKQSMKIGLPTGIQQTFVALGMTAILGIVNEFGTSTAAAYIAASTMDSFAAMPAMAISVAIATFVGQNIGAGKFDRVKKGFRSTLILSSAISVIVSAIMIFKGKILISFFTTDLEVQNIGYSYLVIVSSFYILFSIMFTTNGALRGAGDTIIPMFITLVSLWILRIPLSYYLSRESFGLGSDGIWWGIPIAWAFGAIASYIYFMTGRWKKKKITQ